MAIDEPLSLSPSLDIPVIDISGYLAGDIKATRDIASQLNAAAQAPGFFQIVGHGVPADLRKSLLDRIAAFFALPADQKNALHRHNSKALRGFETLGEQQLEPGFADVKEGFMIGAEIESKDARYLQGPNQWPANGQVDGLENTFMEYFQRMRDLSKVMFRLMALSLSLDEFYFDEFASGKDCKRCLSRLSLYTRLIMSAIAMCRAHRYPPVTPEASLRSRGIGAHTDFGALTLLLQDDGRTFGNRHCRITDIVYSRWSGGFPSQDRDMAPCQGRRRCICRQCRGHARSAINIGRFLHFTKFSTERWTNNHYTSTLHRVTSPVSDKYRYSVAFFNEGLLDQTIECIPTCLSDGEKPLYEPVRVEEHLRKRYGSSYLT